MIQQAQQDTEKRGNTRASMIASGTDFDDI